ncbi:hypothetical protein [Microbacterium paulum]
MSPKPRYRRATPDDQSPSAAKSTGPVVMPVVEFTVHPDGSMTVAVDGAPHTPPPFAPAWRRESFPAILDDLAARHATPLRVHVREADGTTFTDIITPPKPRTTAEPWDHDQNQDQAVPASTVAPAKGTAPVVLHQVSGAGFVPGEDVAVAIIHAHSDAGSDGTARALLTASQLATAHTGEVILLGRVSGTLVIGRPQ